MGKRIIDMNIRILQSKSLTPATAKELNGLLREFRPDCEPSSIRQWRGILAQRNLRLFVVGVKREIFGMAILRWHDLPVGRVGALEDVVVAREHQGKGYGSQLTAAMIDFAKKQKMAYIDLTTRPQRKAANHLYQKFGWERRKTNVYRLSL